MRSAGNFHPEWGYLAPAPSFMRTLRFALVATAIGATAGAAVVVALVAHPASGSTADSSIAAHALVTSVPALNSAAAARSSSAALPPAQSAAATSVEAVAASPAKAASAPQDVAAPNGASGAVPAQVAHVEEPAAAPAHEDTALAPEATPGKKTLTKKHRVSGYEAIRRWQVGREAKKQRHDGGDFKPFFRLFSSRSGSPFSAN